MSGARVEGVGKVVLLSRFIRQLDWNVSSCIIDLSLVSRVPLVSIARRVLSVDTSNHTTGSWCIPVKPPLSNNDPYPFGSPSKVNPRGNSASPAQKSFPIPIPTPFSLLVVVRCLQSGSIHSGLSIGTHRSWALPFPGERGLRGCGTVAWAEECYGRKVQMDVAGWLGRGRVWLRGRV